MINAPSLDLLIRIKNGYLADKKEISIPGSNFKKSILTLLKDNNLIDSFVENTNKNKSEILVKLKYTQKEPSITQVKIYSKPGRRIYTRADSLPWGQSNKALIIISTSKGLRSARDAQKENLGGELIAQVY